MATVAGIKIKNKAPKAVKAKRMTTAESREHAKKDHSPTWTESAEFSSAKFLRHFHIAMDYYKMEFSSKDMKPAVLKWMNVNSYSKEAVAEFKKTKDWRCSATMGGIASCLLRGMPDVRADFNDGRSSNAWLDGAIKEAVTQGKHDIDADEVKAADANKTAVYVPTIQERVKDAAYAMTDEIEDAIEGFQVAPDDFDPKAFKLLNLLKAKGVKAAHSRIIKDLYARDLAELEELATGKGDEQLKEGYSHRSKKQIRTLITFYQEIAAACDMLAQEAKVNRAPRAKKPVAKDKLIAKLKYMKTNEPLKLVSVNPVDIIGASELWVYNTKTRKLGKYVAAEFNTLGVKGTSITNFDEVKSLQKTIRKPEEKLKEFKAAGKIQLRKFLDDINATDTKLNGRIGEETILLKVA